jgi:hypothetical protein
MSASDLIGAAAYICGHTETVSTSCNAIQLLSRAFISCEQDFANVGANFNTLTCKGVRKYTNSETIAFLVNLMKKHGTNGTFALMS